MKKLIFALPIILILGCAPNETITVETPEQPTEIAVEEIKEQLKEEIKEELKEEIKAEEEAKEEEITVDNYDYKTDPDTLIVEINDDNKDEYFDMIIVPRIDGTYSVCTHSLMYDKGYVVVGTEYCDLLLYVPGLDGPVGSNICSFTMPYVFTTEEDANECLKDINNYTLTISSQEAKIYFQKIEDVKFGYEIEGNVRIVNGVENYCIEGNPY